MAQYKSSKSNKFSDDYEDYVSDSVKDDDKSNVHLISFKQPEGCPLYEQIMEGNKTVEGRKNSPLYQKIQVGDTLLLSDRSRGILELKVTYIHLYDDVSEYIAGEGIDAVFGNPTKCRNITNVQDGLKIYDEFVNKQQIIDLMKRFGQGFMGIGIKFLHEYKRYFENVNEPWFSAIRDGLKIAEGRLDKSWVKTLKPYDMIEFTRVPPKNEKNDTNDTNNINNTNKVRPKIEVIVTDVKRYKSFTDLFDDVGLDKVLPGKTSYDEGVAVYRQWYSVEKEKELGVVGIFIKVIKK